MMSSRSDAMREVTDMPAPYFVMPVVLHVEDEVIRVKDEQAIAVARRCSEAPGRSARGVAWLNQHELGHLAEVQ